MNAIGVIYLLGNETNLYEKKRKVMNGNCY